MISRLIRHSHGIYTAGMAALIAAWPTLILTGVFGWPTYLGWAAAALAFGGAGIAMTGVVLDIVREARDGS